MLYGRATSFDGCLDGRSLVSVNSNFQTRSPGLFHSNLYIHATENGRASVVNALENLYYVHAFRDTRAHERAYKSGPLNLAARVFNVVGHERLAGCDYSWSYDFTSIDCVPESKVNLFA